MTSPRFVAAVSFFNFSTSRRDSSRVMFAFARLKYADIEYGYPIVVTPGVASARSNPFSFTTIPIISGSSALGGREAFSFVITFSLSAICFTCLGETKLTPSMCLNPASTSSFKYSALYSVGICSGSPCHASRGHSISFTGSIIHYLSNFPTEIHYGVHHASNEQYQASDKRNPIQEAIVWVAISLRNIPATLGRAMDCE